MIDKYSLMITDIQKTEREIGGRPLRERDLQLQLQ